MTIELSPSLLSSLTITITFNFIAIAITFTLTFSVIFIAITFTSIFIYDPLSLLMNLILTLFDCVADDEADAIACPPSIPLPPPPPPLDDDDTTTIATTSYYYCYRSFQCLLRIKFMPSILQVYYFCSYFYINC
mmetsp:Transcript_9070/g.10590  ORF Transcript_9070/g.10590 Transcript_9070/m.10590 type:complete len:134 (-) Transcript_9070:58-459(-)